VSNVETNHFVLSLCDYGTLWSDVLYMTFISYNLIYTWSNRTCAHILRMIISEETHKPIRCHKLIDQVRNLFALATERKTNFHQKYIGNSLDEQKSISIAICKTSKYKTSGDI